MFVIASKNDMVVSEYYEDLESEQEARTLLASRAMEKLGLDLAHAGWQFDVLSETPEGFSSAFSFYPGNLKY